LHRHEEAQQAEADDQQRRQRKIHQDLARVEELRFLFRLVRIFCERRTGLLGEGENSFARFVLYQMALSGFHVVGR
jgi:hypothetical protein